MIKQILEKYFACTNERRLTFFFQTFDGNELIECIKKLVSIEKDWVPNSNKASLYIRPTLIGTEVCLVNL